MPQPSTLSISLTGTAAADLAAAFTGLRPVAEQRGSALRSMKLDGWREIEVRPGRSGRRPAHITRADWAAARRVDSWRRRRNRRHGAPTQLARTTTVFPRVSITPGDGPTSWTVLGMPDAIAWRSDR